MRKYVIFYWHVFSDRDWIRYSCDAMRRRGYDVQVVQLCEALEGIPLSRFERQNFYGVTGALSPACHADLEAILDGLSPNDLILIASPITPEYLWLHLQVGRRGLKYVQLTLGRLPQELPWKILLRQDIRAGVCAWFSLFMHLGYRAKFHLKLLSALGWNYFRVPPPVLWGKAGSARPYFATDGVHLWRSKTVELESFDVSWARRSQSTKPPIDTRRYAVFVDEALCDHPDYLVNKTPSPTDRSAYFRGLRSLFDSLKEIHGLDTVVALHPKANYRSDELETLFGRRPVLAGHTPELIRDASLAMFHNSTSICYAVVWRKPIFFITNDDIDASWLRPDIYIRSVWLNQPIVNLDDTLSGRKPDIPVQPVDENLYAGYEDRFLRARRAESGPPAEILADRFEHLMHTTPTSSPPVP